ncbi:MAG: PilZ domain-containing protein [Planctomycetota bacterium]
MSIRRRQYRSTVDPTDPVIVEVYRTEESPARAKILDSSSEGVRIEVSGFRDKLRIGSVLYIRFSGLAFPKSVVTTGKVVRVESDERCAVRFLDFLGLRAQIPAAAEGIFNRRFAIRVPGPNDAAISVAVSIEGDVSANFHGELADVSETGVAVVLPPQTSEFLTKGTTVRVGFRPVLSVKQLEYFGLVRHLQELDQGILTGIYFERPVDPDSEVPQRLALARFISRLKK